MTAACGVLWMRASARCHECEYKHEQDSGCRFFQVFSKCTKHTVDSKSNLLVNIHWFCLSTRYYQELEHRSWKRLLKCFWERIPTETRSIYPSFFLWHTLKYSNREVGRDTTQPHEFKWRMPWMPMVSVLPAATNLYFPYGSLNDKWKLVCALLSLPALPPGTKAVKSQGNSDSWAQHTKGT